MSSINFKFSSILPAPILDGEELHLIVRNSATGEILKGDDAPKADELEEWLEQNPGFEVISRDAASDSDDENSDDGYKEHDHGYIKEDEFEGIFACEYFEYHNARILLHY